MTRTRALSGMWVRVKKLPNSRVKGGGGLTTKGAQRLNMDLWLTTKGTMAQSHIKGNLLSLHLSPYSLSELRSGRKRSSYISQFDDGWCYCFIHMPFTQFHRSGFQLIPPCCPNYVPVQVRVPHTISCILSLRHNNCTRINYVCYIHLLKIEL